MFVSCARGVVVPFGDPSILFLSCYLIGADIVHEQALLVDPPGTWKVDETGGSDHAEVDLPVAGAILGNESIVLQVREAGGLLAQNARTFFVATSTRYGNRSVNADRSPPGVTSKHLR